MAGPGKAKYPQRLVRVTVGSLVALLLAAAVTRSERPPTGAGSNVVLHRSPSDVPHGPAVPSSRSRGRRGQLPRRERCVAAESSVVGWTSVRKVNTEEAKR